MLLLEAATDTNSPYGMLTVVIVQVAGIVMFVLNNRNKASKDRVDAMAELQKEHHEDLGKMRDKIELLRAQHEECERSKIRLETKLSLLEAKHKP